MFVTNPAWLLTYFEWAEFDYTVVAPSTKVARNNPSRFTIAFVNNGTSAISISTRARSSAGYGWRVDPTGLPLVLDFRQFGPIVGSEFWGSVATSGENLTVFELVFKPDR